MEDYLAPEEIFEMIKDDLEELEDLKKILNINKTYALKKKINADGEERKPFFDVAYNQNGKIMLCKQEIYDRKIFKRLLAALKDAGYTRARRKWT